MEVSPSLAAAKPTNTVLVDVYDVLSDILAPASQATVTTTTTAGTNLSSGLSGQNIPQAELPPPLEHAPDCRLLDGFAISIQVLMGALALSSLVYKRHRERPRRPVKIWLFDVSKQVLGQLIVHILNILVSVLVGSQGTSVYMKEPDPEVSVSGKHGSNPCVWYILNLLVDCTIGVAILYLFLWTISVLLARAPFAVQGILPFGNYAPEGISQLENPKQTRISYWAKQTGIYVVCLFLMKVCVVLLFEMLPSIFVIGHYILRWTEGDTRVQVAFVMLIFPLLMNTLQFWLIDTIIKAKTHVSAGLLDRTTTEAPRIADDHGEDETDPADDPPSYQPLLRSAADSHDRTEARLSGHRSRNMSQDDLKSRHSADDFHYSAGRSQESLVVSSASR